MRHASRLDATGAVGYLETDRQEAVGFYERFGYVYAAVGAMLCLALVPLQFRAGPSLERLLSAAVFGAAFFAARQVRRM